MSGFSKLCSPSLRPKPGSVDDVRCPDPAPLAGPPAHPTHSHAPEPQAALPVLHQRAAILHIGQLAGHKDAVRPAP